MTTVARVVLQSQLVAGSSSPVAAVDDGDHRHALGTRLVDGGVGAVIALLGLMIGAARSTRGWFVVALGAVLICVSEALTGHAAALRHPALSIATDVTHVLGAGAWIGALVLMVVVGLPALGRMNPPNRRESGSSLTRSYHTAAVDGVILVVLEWRHCRVSSIADVERALDDRLRQLALPKTHIRGRRVGVRRLSLAASRHVRMDQRHPTALRPQRAGRADRWRHHRRAHVNAHLDRAASMTATPDATKTAWPITFDDVRAARERIAPFLAPTPFRRYPRLAPVGGLRHRRLRQAREPPADELVQDPERSLVHDGAQAPTSAGAASSRRRRATTGKESRTAANWLGVSVTVCVPAGNNPGQERRDARARRDGRRRRARLRRGRRRDAAHRRARKGASIAHSTNDPRIVAGAATMTLEILAQEPDASTRS